jgi:zinc/manganese transport system permease protein
VPATRTLLAAAGWQSNWLDILALEFMRNALVAGAMVAVASAAIGYFVVIRRSAFAAHALAHVGFPGATLAVLLGVPVTAGLAVFCVGGALTIGALGSRVEERDTATGTVLAFATALGVLFASLAARSATTVTNVLFGNLLAITTQQLVAFAVLLAVVLVVLAFVARPLTLASVNPSIAEARGLPVGLLGVVFLVLLGLVVAMAVQVVGTLLLFALVVTPPAAALRLTARPGGVVAVAAGIGLGAVVVGLVLSAMFNLPPSFFVVAVAVAVWAVVLVATRRRPWARAARSGVVAEHC